MSRPVCPNCLKEMKPVSMSRSEGGVKQLYQCMTSGCPNTASYYEDGTPTR